MPEVVRHGAPVPVLQYRILDVDGAFVMRPDDLFGDAPAQLAADLRAAAARLGLAA